ncbi:MAG: hypothetical protein ACI4EV_04030, partial [Lachnospiraceae bacterium]
RKVMSVLLVVFLFLPWLRYEASGGGVTAGVSFSGFTMIGQFFVSLLLFVMPAAIIVAMFLPEKIKNIKALYMVCPPIGIVIAVLIGIIAPLYLKSGVDVSGVSEKCIWGIGLWLTIVDYVLIFVSTIAIELNITKDSLKGDGFKNVAKQSLDAVKNSAKELASKE